VMRGGVHANYRSVTHMPASGAYFHLFKCAAKMHAHLRHVCEMRMICKK